MRNNRAWLRRTEILLWFAGALCVLLCVVTAVRAHGARVEAANIATPAAQAGGAALRRVAADQPNVAATAGVIGRMEIPQLHLAVPILGDYDPESLRRGVGHIKGTAFPGGLGTVGLAGHRDTFLRPLKDVTPGMVIRLADRTGTYEYRVDRTEIVTPEQVEVLDIEGRPELALVTCYPFYYVGSAPKRFVVHAHLLSLLPE